MDIVYLYFAIGFIVVFAFSVNFFNQPGYAFIDQVKDVSGEAGDSSLEPALPKYLTERFEYNLFRAAFVLITETVYILLVFFSDEVIFVWDTVDSVGMGSSAASDAGSDSASNPLGTDLRERIILATLIITGIAPNMPGLKQLLEKAKLYLHRKAQIPQKGRTIYRRLKQNQPVYLPSRIDRVLRDPRFTGSDELHLRPDLEADDFKQAPWTIEARWAKLSYLLFSVEQWSEKFPFKSYIQNPELKYEQIDTQYHSLRVMVANLKNNTLTDSDRYKLENGIEAALNRTYRLISCLLYLAAKSDSIVDGYLDEIGYPASENNEFPIPWNTTVIIFLALCVSVVLGSALVTGGLLYFGQQMPEDLTTGRIVRWIGFGAPFLMIPIIQVLFVKRYLSTRGDAWPTATEEGYYKSLGQRPWFIYFLVSLSSYVIAAMVLLVLTFGAQLVASNIKSMQPDASTAVAESRNLPADSEASANSDEQPKREPGDRIRSILAWSCIVFLTTGFIAYRLDSGTRPDISRRRYFLIRTIGAFSQGVLTAVLIFFIYHYTKDSPLHLIFRGGEQFAPTLLVLCTNGFLLGLTFNIATGIGRLRQRRKSGRKITHRKITLNVLGQDESAETLNVSPQGALVNVENNESLGGNLQNLTATLKTEDGQISAEANIVRRRGNQLHLSFINLDSWDQLRDYLQNPVQPA
jgi:hypothetical protein